MMKLKITIAVIFSLLIFQSSYAQNISESKDNLSNKANSTILLSFTPGGGYSTDQGWSVNVLPITIEYSFYNRIGIRFLPFIELTANGIESLSFTFTLPIYILKSTNEQAYRGLYIAPLIGYGRNLLTNSNSIPFGYEVGFAWSFKNGMFFSIFFNQAWNALNINHNGMAIGIQVGYWVF